MAYAAVSLPVILVHMGTLMKLKDIKQEWKTVIIAFVGLIALSVGLFFIAGPILGREMALTAAGPISGGIVATIIVSEAAKKVGFEHLAVFATLLLVLQNFVGLPIASLCLKSETKRLLVKFRSGEAEEATAGNATKSDPEVPSIRLFPAFPKAMQTPFVLLAKTAIVGWVALLAAQHYNAMVLGAGLPYLQLHKFVMALIMGIVFYETGFLEHKVLDKANAMGYAMFFCLIFIWVSLPQATPELVRSLVYPLVVCFGVALVGIVISTYFTSKLLGYSWALATAIAVTCLFGFPATFIITDEVTTAGCADPKEKEYCMSHLRPRCSWADSPRSPSAPSSRVSRPDHRDSGETAVDAQRKRGPDMSDLLFRLVKRRCYFPSLPPPVPEVAQYPWHLGRPVRGTVIGLRRPADHWGYLGEPGAPSGPPSPGSSRKARSPPC